MEARWSEKDARKMADELLNEIAVNNPIAAEFIFSVCHGKLSRHGALKAKHVNQIGYLYNLYCIPTKKFEYYDRLERSHAPIEHDEESSIPFELVGE